MLFRSGPHLLIGKALFVQRVLFLQKMPCWLKCVHDSICKYGFGKEVWNEWNDACIVYNRTFTYVCPPRARADMMEEPFGCLEFLFKKMYEAGAEMEWFGDVHRIHAKAGESAGPVQGATNCVRMQVLRNLWETILCVDI